MHRCRTWSPCHARRAGFTLLGASLVLGASLAGGSAASLRPAQSASSFPAPTWVDTAGPVALSSPTVATIDGVTAVVFASENGFVNVVNALTGTAIPGWPEPVDVAPGVPSAIESSPTVAYLDGPGAPPSIIVGAGSTYLAHQQGGLVAFNADGSVRFIFRTRDIYNEWSGSSTPGPDGYREAVFSTPAIGDVDGSGRPDIVFGSYDHELYALNRSGRVLRGFPVDTQDTIWSSAALLHVRGSHRQQDIFIGGDASGKNHCYGGFVYDFTYRDHEPRLVWSHCESQTIWSSPAIAPIGRNGRPAVVVGTGFGERPPYKPGTNRLYAFDAKSGKRLRHWPVATTGPVFGSPAVGLLPGSGRPAIVDTAWCTSCGAGASTVTAWSATGQVLWSRQLPGASDFASPILVDLTGEGANDVLVGSAAGLYALSGTDGSFLFNESATTPINTCSVQNSPVVAYLPGTDAGAGWRLFESCGGPTEVNPIGRLFDYPLPAAPGVAPPWPQWRANASHSGVGTAS